MLTSILTQLFSDHPNDFSSKVMRVAENKFVCRNKRKIFSLCIRRDEKKTLLLKIDWWRENVR